VTQESDRLGPQRGTRTVRTYRPVVNWLGKNFGLSLWAGFKPGPIPPLEG